MEVFTDDVDNGTYFWFYPSVSMNVTNRVISAVGLEDFSVASADSYKATYTVGSSDNVSRRESEIRDYE